MLKGTAYNFCGENWEYWDDSSFIINFVLSLVAFPQTYQVQITLLLYEFFDT